MLKQLKDIRWSVETADTRAAQRARLESEANHAAAEVLKKREAVEAEGNEYVREHATKRLLVVAEARLERALARLDSYESSPPPLRASLVMPRKKPTQTLSVPVETYFKFEAQQSSVPADLGLLESGKRLWWFRDAFYESDQDLSADDVQALVLEKENRKRLQLEKAHALMAMRQQLDTRAKRQPIPQDVKVLVWQRDGGRCVECGSNESLEYDHIIPLAMGGSDTDRNLQLLCEICNRRKGATLG